MTKKPKDESQGEMEAESADPDDKPTIIPQFDPEAFAREVTRADPWDEEFPPLRGTTMPPPAEYRPQASTVTNETELEFARQRSAMTGPPPPDTALDTTHKPESVRASLLSMADARASIEPPPRVNVQPWSSKDKSWEELTLDEPISDEPPRRSDAPVAHVGPPKLERTLFKTLPPKQSAGPSGEFTVWAPGRAAAAAAAAAIQPDRRAEPERPVLSEPPQTVTSPASHAFEEDPTIFSPARAAAALTRAAASPSRSGDSAPATALSPQEDTLREMRDRFSLGDYTGALVLAEGLQEDLPHNAEIAECAESCRSVLRQMYTARIGPLDRVPVVTVARDQLRWLSIDHRAGFVLSHIDGISSLEMILDVSGMPLLDALRILCELAQQRIISFR